MTCLLIHNPNTYSNWPSLPDIYVATHIMNALLNCKNSLTSSDLLSVCSAEGMKDQNHSVILQWYYYMIKSRSKLLKLIWSPNADTWADKRNLLLFYCCFSAWRRDQSHTLRGWILFIGSPWLQISNSLKKFESLGHKCF